MEDTLKCDYCEIENQFSPIIQSPIRFGFKGKIVPVPQINKDGRQLDNVCVSCLEFEILELKG